MILILSRSWLPYKSGSDKNSLWFDETFLRSSWQSWATPSRRRRRPLPTIVRRRSLPMAESDPAARPWTGSCHRGRILKQYFSPGNWSEDNSSVYVILQLLSIFHFDWFPVSSGVLVQMLSSLTFDLFQVGSFHSLFLTSFRSAQESWYSFLRSIGKETEAHAFEELIITEGKTERERERERDGIMPQVWGS